MVVDYNRYPEAGAREPQDPAGLPGYSPSVLDQPVSAVGEQSLGQSISDSSKLREVVIWNFQGY